MFETKRYIYQVYKEMSFSKAAKSLFISQPSLSAAVKKVEKQLGFQIFDRSTTPIQLTEFGKEYIKSMEIIMDVEKGFENYIRDVNELKRGEISIGGTNMFASLILPPLLSEFTQKYPFVDINLKEASSGELKEKLFAGQLDVVIDNAAMDDSVYDKVFFCEEHLLLAVPKKLVPDGAGAMMTCVDIKNGKHLEPGTPVTDLTLFQELPFLFLKSGNDTRDREERICHHAGFVPGIKLKLDQQITAYYLSCYGMGISFTGDILIKRAEENDHVGYFKLDDREAAREVYFYYKRNRYMSRAMEAFLNQARAREEEVF